MAVRDRGSEKGGQGPEALGILNDAVHQSWVENVILLVSI